VAEVSVNADGSTVTLVTDNTALSDRVHGSDSLVTKVVNAIGAAETTSAFGPPFCSLLPMAYIDTIGSHRLDIDSMLTGVGVTVANMARVRSAIAALCRGAYALSLDETLLRMLWAWRSISP
jgi:hypothetical protein